MSFLKNIRVLASGFRLWELELYCLNSRPPEQCANFLPRKIHHQRIRPLLNPAGQEHILKDKWLTHFILAGLGIPTPQTLGCFHPKTGKTIGGYPLKTFKHLSELLDAGPPHTYIAKPRGGSQGQDTFLFSSTIEFQERLPTPPDKKCDPTQGHYEGALIIQRVLPQHPALSRINSSCINSLRIVTFVDSDGGAHIDCAILKLGRAGNAVDNWDQGGLSVAIDLDSGQMGSGYTKPKHGGTWHTHHPDSGTRISGESVPFWSEALSLSLRAAESFCESRSIGWDIAITPEGPVILEGNSQWDLSMIQVHTDGYLTDARRKNLSSYGITLPKTLRPTWIATAIWLTSQLRRSRVGRFFKPYP